MNERSKSHKYKNFMFSISILNSNEKLVEYFMIYNSIERKWAQEEQTDRNEYKKDTKNWNIQHCYEPNFKNSFLKT